MNQPSVLFHQQKGLVTITLNRPDRRNALSRDLIHGLTESFTKVKNEPDVRVVVLTGAGTTFCAGMDLVELQESMQGGHPPDDLWQEAMKLARLFDLIYTLNKPTIAVVNGTAVAGGAGLVSVCDLAIAVDDAKFGYPEVRRGLVAAMVLPHLLRHVGERMARFLLLSGELITAERAVQAGLINEVVVRSSLMERTSELTSNLMEGGPQALAQTKVLLKQFSRQAISIEDLAQESTAPRLNEECRLGLEAFFNKQPAPWAKAK